jgi:hypothetical protein
MKNITNPLQLSPQQMRVGSSLDEDSLVKKQHFKKKAKIPQSLSDSIKKPLPPTNQNNFSKFDRYDVNEFYRLLESTNERSREEALKDSLPTKPEISIVLVDQSLSKLELNIDSSPELKEPSTEQSSYSFLIAKGTISYDHNRKRKQRYERNVGIAAPFDFFSSTLEDHSSSEGLEPFYCPDISFEIFQVLNICYSIECQVVNSLATRDIMNEKKLLFISQIL